MGAWTVVAATTGVLTRREDFLASARRGLAGATACAFVVALAIATALTTDDFAVRFVAANSSLLMPGQYLLPALLASPAGALPAWAAFAGAAASFTTRGLSGSREARAWSVAAAAGAIAIALMVSSAFAPLARSLAVPGDGAGLAPTLQRGAAVVQTLSFLIGAAAAAGGFVLTVAALAGRAVSDGWSRSIRRWNALIFVALLIGVVAGSRLFALDPSRGAWLADQDTTLSLIAVSVGAWLVLLDRGPQGADRVVMRLLLSVGAFIATTAAMVFAGSAFARGSAAPSPASIWFAAVPMGALVVIVALLRNAKGALGSATAIATLPRDVAASWLSRIGLVLLAGAAIGSSFAAKHDVELGDTEIFRVKDPLGRQWSFKSQGISTIRRENYGSRTFTVLPERDGTALPLLSAESRIYLLADGEEPVSSALVGGTSSEPLLEARLSLIGPDGAKPMARIEFVPLATWLIPGAALLALGALVTAFRPESERRVQ